MGGGGGEGGVAFFCSLSLDRYISETFFFPLQSVFRFAFSPRIFPSRNCVS